MCPEDDLTQKLHSKLKRPFLPAIKSTREYTLVLDLDETLAHYDEEFDSLEFRPGAH